MKQFFEQYGGVALGILALIVLIAMITPVGNIIKTSLQGTTETFSSKMNSQTDTMSEQMSNIMNTAGEFLNVKENGKMYKGDELYTGWSGDKAYLEGEETIVYTNARSGPRALVGGNTDIDDPDTVFLYIKVDGKTIRENFRSGADIAPLTIAFGVSSIEIMVKYPSKYYATFKDQGNLYNGTFEVIREDEDFTYAKMTGILRSFANPANNDVGADDIYLYLK